MAQPSIERMWINQPSTAQALHHLHGVNVLAVHEYDDTYRIYFLSGDIVSQQCSSLSLSKGWNGATNAHLIAAAPAMYEALSDAEGMWNIARLIDSKHHAGNPISNDLWSDFHQYLMEWHAKRKDALAQAEGKP